jgi:DNA-binding MarR family transcriptional regulator
VSTPEPRWLSPTELRSWRSLMELLARLPAALEVQLQRDSQLSLLEYYVLAGLSDAPDHRMRLSRLAALADSELSRLSHLVTRLERRGLVRREPDETDGRYTNAVLTQGGIAYLAQAAPAHVEEVRRLVFDVLDESDLAVLDSITERVNQQLGDTC